MYLLGSFHLLERFELQTQLTGCLVADHRVLEVSVVAAVDLMVLG